MGLPAVFHPARPMRLSHPTVIPIEPPLTRADIDRRERDEARRLAHRGDPRRAVRRSPRRRPRPQRGPSFWRIMAAAVSTPYRTTTSSTVP